MLICSTELQAQQITLGFYNVENLFDTINDPGVDDGDFTPMGSKRWTQLRYRSKIKMIGRIISSMECDIIGVCEVEKQSVVEDIAKECGYDFVHIDSRDSRGMDQALLFRPECFEIDKFSLTGELKREFLLVEGRVGKLPLVVLVVHLPSKISHRRVSERAALELKRVIDSLSVAYRSHLVVMGDFNLEPNDKIFKKILQNDNLLFNPFAPLANIGKGSIVWHNRLKMFDQIMVSHTLLKTFGYKAEIFAPSGLFEQSGERKGYPRRTFVGDDYAGGASDHLPIRLILNQSFHSQ